MKGQRGKLKIAYCKGKFGTCLLPSLLPTLCGHSQDKWIGQAGRKVLSRKQREAVYACSQDNGLTDHPEPEQCDLLDSAVTAMLVLDSLPFSPTSCLYWSHVLAAKMFSLYNPSTKGVPETPFKAGELGQCASKP